ncbi:hypothetical protein [Williamsia sp. 1135]|uniref:hypothetical protein n=1 Tax=Williamsia sp. 1135 TaxID=1889262 RepID=UPI000A11CC0B|nr:hypothetical protein [Williamsia sp. 1135]ORM37785.1 hypothetical protein BFL43_03010 [Williamsia sp. 1135]
MHIVTSTKSAPQSPNLAAVRTSAMLAGVSFHQALIESLTQWRTALVEAIDQESIEAAHYLGQSDLEEAADKRIACYQQGQDHLEAAGRLAAIRAVAEQMLSDADVNPIHPSN